MTLALPMLLSCLIFRQRLHLELCLDSIRRLDVRANRNPSHDLRLDAYSPGFFTLAALVLENVVHLLERPTVGLRHKEERPDECQNAKYSEKGVSAEACVLDERGCDQADNEVVKPLN